jgi:hypothetical protein
VVNSVIGEADEIAFADAVDQLVAEVLDDAADAVEALGDLGDARIFAMIVEAVAETRLRAVLPEAA